MESMNHKDGISLLTNRESVVDAVILDEESTPRVFPRFCGRVVTTLFEGLVFEFYRTLVSER